MTTGPLSSLPADVTDTILEMFNVGVGRAAAILSRLGGREVVLCVPELAIVPRQELVNFVGPDSLGRICGVKQGFNGTFTGDSLLIFPARQSLELARSLVPEPDMVADMTEMEREALLEVGNIVLNACVSSLADLLCVEIESDIPSIFFGEPQRISDEIVTFGECDLMYLRIDFRIGIDQMKGHVIFLLDLHAADTLRKAVESLLASLGAR